MKTSEFQGNRSEISAEHEDLTTIYKEETKTKIIINQSRLISEHN